MALRQLARQFKSPGTLAQFWQGSSVLAPQVQEQQHQVQAGQQWQRLDAEHGSRVNKEGFGGFLFSNSRLTDQQPPWDARPLFDDAWSQPDSEPAGSVAGMSETSSATAAGTETSQASSPPSSEAAEATLATEPLSRLSQTSIKAQEPITELLDEGSFVPVQTPFAEDVRAANDLYSEEALVTGRGAIDGRPVCVVSQIPAAADGPLSDRHSRQICHLIDHAMEAGMPVISLHDDSPTARPPPTSPSPATSASRSSSSSSWSSSSSHQGNAASLAGFTDVLQRHAEASGVVPQLALSVGRFGMDSAMGFALSDFAFTVDSRRRGRPHFGPAQLGGSNGAALEEQEEQEQMHAVDWAAMLPNRREALAHMRDLLSYLPLSSQHPAPEVFCCDPVDRFCPDLDCLVPDSPSEPYEVREVISAVADEGRWHEVAPHSARNMVTGFARLGGGSVGVVANAPGVLAGCLDGPAASKAARFVRFCDAFNLPLVVLVDSPGFLVPPKEGRAVAVRQGAQLLYAFAEATVPKLTVILRLAHGSAYGVMSSKHLKADVNLAWPSASIAVRGTGGTRQLIFSAHDSLFSDSSTEDGSRGGGGGASPEGLEAPRIARPLAAAQYGIVDAVIRPAMTRRHLCSELALLRGKHAKRPYKKHGNPPVP